MVATAPRLLSTMTQLAETLESCVEPIAEELATIDDLEPLAILKMNVGFGLTGPHIWSEIGFETQCETAIKSLINE